MLSDTFYSVFGLTVASALPLPDLPEAPANSAPDVTIRPGRVDDATGESLSGDARRAVLSIPDVARYEVCEGSAIVVDASPAADERHVRLFLLGSAFGVLLHQRRLLPLHANVVELEGQAVAFVGQSGAGKSTLAAWFHDRGHRVLSDDVCVVGRRVDGAAVAVPGIPRLRLWRDALRRSGRSTDGFEQPWPDDDTYDKFDVPLPAPPGQRKVVPIAAIYQLRQREGPLAIDRLRGSAAVGALISNTYRGAFVATVGDSVEHFRQCHALAADVPIYEVMRSFDPARFEQEADAIEEHALKQIPAPAVDASDPEKSGPRSAS
jgi:hypothetical protein